MRYSFDDAKAPTTKKRQYYAMLGTRGIWENGWKAAALHAPFSGTGHFDQDRWELYHVDEDRAESKTSPHEHPDKLKALIDAWFEEADKNFVLPLDDRTATRDTRHRAAAVRAAREPGMSTTPDTAPIPEGVAVNVRGRSYKIIANVDITNRRRRGDLRARLAVRRPRTVHQGSQAALRLQLPRHPARAELRVRGTDTGQACAGHGVRPGERRRAWRIARHHQLFVDDQAVAKGPMRSQAGKFTLSGDGLCIGFDSGDNVSQQYQNPGTFTGGTILGVAIDVSDEAYLDLEREAAGALARD